MNVRKTHTNFQRLWHEILLVDWNRHPPVLFQSELINSRTQFTTLNWFCRKYVGINDCVQLQFLKVNESPAARLECFIDASVRSITLCSQYFNYSFIAIWMIHCFYFSLFLESVFRGPIYQDTITAVHRLQIAMKNDRAVLSCWIFLPFTSLICLRSIHLHFCKFCVDFAIRFWVSTFCWSHHIHATCRS